MGSRPSSLKISGKFGMFVNFSVEQSHSQRSPSSLKGKNIHRLARCYEPPVCCWPLSSSLVSTCKIITLTGDDSNDKNSIKEKNFDSNMTQLSQERANEPISIILCGSLCLVGNSNACLSSFRLFSKSNSLDLPDLLLQGKPTKTSILSSLVPGQSPPTTSIFSLITCLSLPPKFHYPSCSIHFCT